MDESTICGNLVLLRNAITEARSMLQYDTRRKQALADIRDVAERLERVPALRRITDLAWSCADYNLSWTDDDYTELLKQIARRLVTADEETEQEDEE